MDGVVVRTATTPVTRNVLLINLTRTVIEDSRFQHESLALGYLSKVLEIEGFVPYVIDCQVEPLADPDIFKRAAEVQPALIGICSSVQIIFPRLRKFVQDLRMNNIKSHVVIGGDFATIAARKILEEVPEIDSICLGEGELVVTALATRLTSGQSYHDIVGLASRDAGTIVGDSGVSFVQDMDALPFPTRKTISSLKALGRRCRLMASRGCVSRCNFCTAEKIMDLGSPRRQRSPRHVVDEMVALYEEHGVSRFRFNDPIFIGAGKPGAQWGFAFCEELRRQGKHGVFDMIVHLRSIEAKNRELMFALAQAGVSRVLLGVETASDSMLRWMRKPAIVGLNDEAIEVLQSNGIIVELGFIFFLPPMTLTDIEINLQFLERNGFIDPYTLTSSLEVYIGCYAEKQLQAQNNLERENWWDYGKWKFSDPETMLFWEYLTPVLSVFPGISEYLHLLDVRLQPQKAEGNPELNGQTALRRLSWLVGKVLLDSYIGIIACIRTGDSPDLLVHESRSKLEDLRLVAAEALSFEDGVAHRLITAIDGLQKCAPAVMPAASPLETELLQIT